MQTFLFILTFIIIVAIFYFAFRKKTIAAKALGTTEKNILQQQVLFYQQLAAKEKLRFESGVQIFLQQVRITGIKTTVEDIDRVFVAAAAIIPIFGFPGWQYRNIHEVLLYPGSFNKSYQQEGEGRDTLGMVGNGPMQNVMILSQQDLRNGFQNHTDTSNTAIHEFVHLVDKADGDTDGLPEALLQHQYVLPWLQRIHEEIKMIKSDDSDINPYGITNEAEFFAVASEYFFKQPHLMKEKHPELFKMLTQIFLPATEAI